MREQLEALIAAEAEDRAKGRAWTAEMWRARLGVSLDPLNEFHIGDTVRVRESTGYLMPYVFRCGTVVSGSGYVTVTSPVVPGSLRVRVSDLVPEPLDDGTTDRLAAIGEATDKLRARVVRQRPKFEIGDVVFNAVGIDPHRKGVITQVLEVSGGAEYGVEPLDGGKWSHGDTRPLRIVGEDRLVLAPRFVVNDLVTLADRVAVYRVTDVRRDSQPDRFSYKIANTAGPYPDGGILESRLTLFIPKFKVGDRVTVIQRPEHRGDVRVVTAIRPTNFGISCMVRHDGPSPWQVECHEQFLAPATRFQIGDQVHGDRTVANPNRVFTVAAIRTDPNGDTVYDLDAVDRTVTAFQIPEHDMTPATNKYREGDTVHLRDRTALHPNYDYTIRGIERIPAGTSETPGYRYTIVDPATGRTYTDHETALTQP